MKKKLKRAGAALAALALCAGMMPAAFAATESVVSWDFVDTTSSWNTVSGWSGGVTVTTSVENEMLKIDANYGTAKEDWRPASVGYTFEEAQDLTGVTEISYDLYVPTEKKDVITQSYAIVQEPWDSTTSSAPYTSNSVRLSEISETSEETIGGTGYTKYQIAMKLTPYTAGVTLADITSNVKNIIIQVIGTSAETITTYIDNVSLNKEAASEEPGGDYLYTYAGSVEMELPSLSSRWPSTEVKIDPAVTVYPGAVVEYVVTLANNDFTKFYTEPKFNWTGIANMTVTPNDLTYNSNDGTYSFHFKGTYDVYGDKEPTTIEEVNTMQIVLQNAYDDAGTDYDYKGEVKVTDIKVTNGKAPETTIKADQINNDTFTDGSQGWTVEVDANALTSGAQWVITNSEDKTAKVNAVIEPSVEANVRIGLVLTETAIGGNTITGVSLKY